MIFLLCYLLQTPGDEVQPFRLDEEFDYDTVTLTPKFSPAEIEAIRELSQRRWENTSTDLEEPCDWFTNTSSCLLFFGSYSSHNRINDKPTIIPLWKCMCALIHQHCLEGDATNKTPDLHPHRAPLGLVVPAALGWQGALGVACGDRKQQRFRFDESTVTR